MGFAMKRIHIMVSFAAVLACMVWSVTPGFGDEGLWLFSDPPRAQLKEKYAMEVTDSWLENLAKSCARIGWGGSGSFVSPDGLLLTNHHVAFSWFANIPGQNMKLLQDGFLADAHAQEIKCPGLEVSITWESEDVTGRVLGAIEPGMSPAAAYQARNAVCAAIEKESQEKTGLISEVDSLYRGAKYRLFRYRKYSDVRLVFAPEYAASRYFDCCFLRAYEDGRPAKIKHYLRLAGAEPRLGDSVFTAGFPAQTDRLLSAAHLDALYGKQMMQRMKWLSRTEAAINRFIKESPVQDAWGALAEQKSIEESFNRLWYILGPTLEDDLASKRAQERAVRKRLEDQPQKLARYLEAEKQLSAMIKELDTLYQAHFFLESGRAFNSQLFSHARVLVRIADEMSKPIADRLPEYSGVWLAERKSHLAAPREIGKKLEQVILTESLRMFSEWAGETDELVLRVLAGKTPEERARQLVQESHLDDAAVRIKLLEGGKKVLDASADPMIELAKMVDGPARKIRLAYEEKVREPTRQAYPVLLEIRDALNGKENYPDATNSLRFAFGRLQNVDRLAQWATIKDLFSYMSASKREGDLPFRWAAAQIYLDGSTQMWLTSNADGAGGNSGSPVVDRAGRLVGIVARGENHAQIIYREHTSNNYAVSASGMLALLGTVYDAGNLLKELGKSAGKKVVAKNNQETTKPELPLNGSSPFIPPSSGQQVLGPIVYEGIDKRHKSLVPGLIAALKDSDKEVVQAVTLALGNIGPSAIPALVEVLKSRDKILRARAATSLGKIGYVGDNAIPALLEALQDEEPEVRREAARAIALIVQVPALPPNQAIAGNPEAKEILPTAAQLIGYVNNNTDRIKSLRVSELEITMVQGIQTLGLTGNLVAERPKNFRLMANVLGNPALDIGCNEKVDWNNVRRNDGTMTNMPFPIQPKLLMEALGLSTIGDAQKYELEHDAKTLKLVEKTTLADGTTVRKIFVFKRDAERTPTPQATNYLLLDDRTGKEIWHADVRETQIDPATNVILPRVLEVRWTSGGQSLKLVMKLKGIIVNGDIPAQSFRLPELQKKDE